MSSRTRLSPRFSFLACMSSRMFGMHLKTQKWFPLAQDWLLRSVVNQGIMRQETLPPVAAPSTRICVADGEKETCVECADTLIPDWDDNRGLWVYYDVVRKQGKAFHIQCFEGYRHRCGNHKEARPIKRRNSSEETEFQCLYDATSPDPFDFPALL
jgi:hypothetical protein